LNLLRVGLDQVGGSEWYADVIDTACDLFVGLYYRLVHSAEGSHGRISCTYQAHQGVVLIFLLATTPAMLLGAMELLAHAMIVSHRLMYFPGSILSPNTREGDKGEVVTLRRNCRFVYTMMLARQLDQSGLATFLRGCIANIANSPRCPFLMTLPGLKLQYLPQDRRF
jgi:hypothetical protein